MTWRDLVENLDAIEEAFNCKEKDVDKLAGNLDGKINGIHIDDSLEAVRFLHKAFSGYPSDLLEQFLEGVQEDDSVWEKNGWLDIPVVRNDLAVFVHEGDEMARYADNEGNIGAYGFGITVEDVYNDFYEMGINPRAKGNQGQALSSFPHVLFGSVGDTGH